MRIGIDVTALPPTPVGAGHYMIQLVRELAQLDSGHEFIIFAQKTGRCLIDIPETTPGLTWITLPDKSPALRLVWEQTIFPFLVRRSGAEILHSLHYTRPLFLPCASVVTFHDMTFLLYPHLHTRAKRLFFPMAIRASAWLADALVAISENTQRDTIRLLGVPPDRIFTTPMGVDDSFRPITDKTLLEATRCKYNLPEEFILYVGTIEPRKNLPVLIQAYSNLVGAGYPHKLIAVGRFGWMYEDILQQIQALGLENRVLFTGYLPASDLPMIYNLAQVFVYPSIYEGFGIPPIEAMACGTPVITTAVSAMIDNVGDAGLLVQPKDEQALTQALNALITDPNLRRRLSAKGQERASQFTWKRTAQETLKIYQYVARAWKRL